MGKSDQTKLGTVYLVGAGPGDPGLITLRGVECLGRADVVLYDYLVNPLLLKHVRPEADRICLGRHGHSRLWTQDEVNARLVALSREGKTVARLKSGDPAVFARGGEEAWTLAAERLPFEVVPGITVALAASSCAGIPVTHRDLASAVALVTGQEDDAKSGSSLDFAALARFPGTLVFYMGVTTAEKWTRELIAAGMAPATPAAIVRRCSFPDQQSWFCRLDEVADRMKTLRPPAIVVVGPVTQLASQLNWFERRPLFGQRILVTRPRDQATGLADPLAELGAEVFIQPAIEILPPASYEKIDAVVARLAEFDWIVFSSVNGVEFLLNRMWELGRDSRAFRDLKIAAIGPGTTASLEKFRLRVDLQPDEFRAETLASELATIGRNQRFLLIRASRGREVLAEEIRNAGGVVEQVVVYESRDVDAPDDMIARRMESGEMDWVTVTSSAIARSLVKLFPESIRRCKLASISPVTTGTLRELGLEPTVEATEFTMSGVVDAIVSYIGRDGQGIDDSTSANGTM